MVFNQYWAHEDPEVIVKLDLQQAVYRDNIGSWFMRNIKFDSTSLYIWPAVTKPSLVGVMNWRNTGASIENQ